MNKWKDIKTAPKDGSTMLVFVPLEEGGFIDIAYNGVGRFVSEAMDGEIYPSHWMPLQLPPKETK